MERETGIEPALVAWKATVLPLNYSRSGILHSQNLPTVLLQKSGGGRWITPGILPSALACSLILWWREVDSNHRRHEPADLQSAPVGRLGIPPNSVQTVRGTPEKGLMDRITVCLHWPLGYRSAQSRLLSVPGPVPVKAAWIVLGRLQHGCGRWAAS